jgi:hypothetical protein
VTYYSCNADNNACDSGTTTENDTCSDTGGTSGGGSCEATDWSCTDGTLSSSGTDGTDTCGGTDGSPSVTYWSCTASDGSAGDTCTSGATTESDTCSDTGGTSGGGSCSATDWSCTVDAETGEGALSSSGSSGDDTCGGDADSPSVTYYSCNADNNACDSGTTCLDSGSAYGGGTCGASDWSCTEGQLSVSTSSGTDSCSGADTVSLTTFACGSSDGGSVDDTCSQTDSTQSDSCEDSGGATGGGSCSATDWACDVDTGTISSTGTDGTDSCGGVDVVTIDFFSCSNSDGDADDTCSPDSETYTDSCSDNGDDLGGGSCSATDFSCSGNELAQSDSDGTDSCVDGFNVTSYSCTASDGDDDDSCAPAENDCTILDETCADGVCDVVDGGPDSCEAVFRDPGASCRDGSEAVTDCTLADTCDGAGVCEQNNLECGSVTSSSLCPFDVNPDKGTCEGGDSDGEACFFGDPEHATSVACTDGGGECQQSNQFKLLFTPDVHNWEGYKHNATNPGQYYYNLFHQGAPNSTETVTIAIPYPFVTQGAMPLHVYDGNLVPTGDSGEETDCFLPPETALGAADVSVELGARLQSRVAVRDGRQRWTRRIEPRRMQDHRRCADPGLRRGLREPAPRLGSQGWGHGHQSL